MEAIILMELSTSQRDELLTIRVAEDDGAYVIGLYGELDLASAPRLRRELERAEASAAATVVVDLGAVEFIDSCGLALLIEAQRRCEATGRRLGLLRGPAAVQGLFELTATAQLFRFLD